MISPVWIRASHFSAMAFFSSVFQNLSGGNIKVNSGHHPGCTHRRGYGSAHVPVPWARQVTADGFNGRGWGGGGWGGGGGVGGGGGGGGWGGGGGGVRGGGGGGGWRGGGWVGGGGGGGGGGGVTFLDGTAS